MAAKRRNKTKTPETDTERLRAAWAALDALPNHLKQAVEAGATLHNIRTLLAEKGEEVPT